MGGTGVSCLCLLSLGTSYVDTLCIGAVQSGFDDGPYRSSSVYQASRDAAARQRGMQW